MTTRNAGRMWPLQSDSLRGRALFSVVIAASVLVLYGQTAWFSFVNFDDPPYVTHNPHVLKGITAEGFRWAFTSVYGSNWHPLTWISHMLDVELFGMNAGMHHLTNTLLHALNSVLLFLVLEAATKARGKSALVALLFAVHPLHVESVAWVAERKDVLSTFFGMLATAAYIAYANRPSAWRYLVVAIAFVLGLMAKPMLVTLPLVLIILDFWPLERILPDGKRPDAAARPEGGMPRLSLSRLILEKAPLLALSAASSAVTVYAQYTGGSVRTLDEIPLYQRTANAIVSYVMYLVKTAVPSGLAAFYPFPEAIPAAKVIACGVFLAGVTAAAWALRKRRPYLIAGWLWYVVTLVPVIGLVQVGRQSMADRYTYLSLVGIFVIVVWGADDVLKRFTRSTKPAAALAAIGLAVLMTATYFQVGVWKDSTALFSHAVAVTQGNYIAHYNLGCELQKQGDTGEAISHYEEAIRIKPDLTSARNNLAGILLSQGRLDDAIRQYTLSLDAEPKQARVYNNLGSAYFRKGDLARASQAFARACALDPTYASACKNLKEAQKALKALEKRLAAALSRAREDPKDASARADAGDAYRLLGDHKNARSQYMACLAVDKASRKAIKGLVLVAREESRWDEAVSWLERLASLEPEDPSPLYDMACVYALWGRREEAIRILRRAVEKGFSDMRLLAGDPDLSSIRSDPYVAGLIKGTAG